MKLKHNFKNLKVWQKAVELAVLVYEETKSFPSEEKFGIISQMRRSSVSVSSNIAEGSARNSSKAFVNCLEISLGESFELETQLIIAFRTGIIEVDKYDHLSRKITELQKMVMGFKNTIETPSY
ncbi:MAG: four helix bundle protein [Algoriphagus sp.]